MDVTRAIPIIVTREPAQARSFYVEVLGMQPVMDEDGFLMLASRADRSAAQLIIAWESATAWDPQAARIDLSLDVATPEAVDQAHAAALERGLEILYPLTDEPFGRRRFVVREPSGAALNVACHIPAPG